VKSSFQERGVRVKRLKILPRTWEAREEGAVVETHYLEGGPRYPSEGGGCVPSVNCKRTGLPLGREIMHCRGLLAVMDKERGRRKEGFSKGVGR